MSAGTIMTNVEPSPVQSTQVHNCMQSPCPVFFFRMQFAGQSAPRKTPSVWGQRAQGAAQKRSEGRISAVLCPTAEKASASRAAFPPLSHEKRGVSGLYGSRCPSTGWTAHPHLRGRLSSETAHPPVWGRLQLLGSCHPREFLGSRHLFWVCKSPDWAEFNVFPGRACARMQ